MLQSDYLELARRALDTRSADDCAALAEWFETWGRDDWNGEEYDLSDADNKPSGYWRLRPVYKYVACDDGSLDDDPILVRWEIV